MDPEKISKDKKLTNVTSTPLGKSGNILNISEISNISCLDGRADESNSTITNVTIIEVPTEKECKENVTPVCVKKIKQPEFSKKRKASEESPEPEDDHEIEFIENPHKSIQLNQSTTEEFLRLGSTEAEVAVGIFWDIENVRMPRGLNPAMLITKLREMFVDGSSKYCEKHFYVVCDVKEESYPIMKQLFEFHVRIIHVPRLKANSSDNVIRDLMHEFVGYNKFCRVVLITGDSDFSYDIHNFRRNKKCDCILIHNKNAKESLIKSASSAYLYTDLLKEEMAKLEQKQRDLQKSKRHKITYPISHTKQQKSHNWKPNQNNPFVHTQNTTHIPRVVSTQQPYGRVRGLQWSHQSNQNDPRQGNHQPSMRPNLFWPSAPRSHRPYN